MIDGDHLTRHLIVSKKNEITTVEEANESNFVNEEVLFNALGYSIFEHLRPVNIVFEGWRDKRLFEIAMLDRSKKTKSVRDSFADVGRCYARGTKDVSRITAMLELARRNCIVLSDGDQAAREHQRLYKGHGKSFRYDELLPAFPAVTGEDFVRGGAFFPVIDRLQAEDPRLITAPKFSFDKPEGKLKAVSNWFTRAGLTADEVKVQLERLKEIVFGDLRPDEIEPAYYDMLERFRASMPKPSCSR